MHSTLFDTIDRICATNNIGYEDISLSLNKNKGYLSQIKSRMKSGRGEPEWLEEIIKLRFGNVSPSKIELPEKVQDALRDLAMAQKNISDTNKNLSIAQIEAVKLFSISLGSEALIASFDREAVANSLESEGAKPLDSVGKKGQSVRNQGLSKQAGND